MEVKVIYKTLDEIMPYERNPRDNEKAVEKVAESIKEFGFKVPIIIDKAGIIVAGDTRYKAAKSLGMDKVPTIVAEDLSPYQVKAFRIADNKVAEFSDWDLPKLTAELDEIDFDMEKFGFYDFPDVDIDAFLEDGEVQKKDKEPEKIQCPHCGEWFEKP